VWTAEEEKQESEVPDSTGIRRQARNQERVAKEGYSTLGLTAWLVPTILLVSVEEYSGGSVRLTESGELKFHCWRTISRKDFPASGDHRRTNSWVRVFSLSSKTNQIRQSLCGLSN